MKKILPMVAQAPDGSVMRALSQASEPAGYFCAQIALEVALNEFSVTASARSLRRHLHPTPWKKGLRNLFLLPVFFLLHYPC